LARRGAKQELNHTVGVYQVENKILNKQGGGKRERRWDPRTPPKSRAKKKRKWGIKGSWKLQQEKNNDGGGWGMSDLRTKPGKGVTGEENKSEKG